MRIDHEALQTYQPSVCGGFVGLEQKILRCVWQAKYDGVTHIDLLQMIPGCSEREFTVVVRNLVVEGRLHQERVLEPYGASWPPMRLYLPEYSPINGID